MNANPSEKARLITRIALEGVPESQRDIAMFRLGCMLKRAGVRKLVGCLLVKEAADNCTPPYPWKEAVMSAYRAYTRSPENPEEREVLYEEEHARMDMALRSLAGVDFNAHRRPLVEMGGDELVASCQDGSPTPPSLPLLGQRGYILEGWSHVLAGYPRAGKTELLVRLCREWLDMPIADCGLRIAELAQARIAGADDEGGAGLPPQSAIRIPQSKKVVYITEEPSDLWARRLAAIPGDWSGLRAVFGLGAPPHALFARAFNGDEDVAVIDSMRNLLQLNDETDNSGIAQVLNPWIAEARARQKTLLFAHHMRKGAGPHGEGIAGGHALLGVFDVALELSRDPRVAGRRRIKTYARLVEPPELVYERNDDRTMRALGDPSAVQLAEVVERIRDYLGAEWVKTSQVRDGLGEPLPSLDQCRIALMQSAQRGEIERDPPLDEDAKRRTVRWRRRTEI